MTKSCLSLQGRTIRLEALFVREKRVLNKWPCEVQPTADQTLQHFYAHCPSWQAIFSKHHWRSNTSASCKIASGLRRPLSYARFNVLSLVDQVTQQIKSRAVLCSVTFVFPHIIYFWTKTYSIDFLKGNYLRGIKAFFINQRQTICIFAHTMSSIKESKHSLKVLIEKQLKDHQSSIKENILITNSYLKMYCPKAWCQKSKWNDETVSQRHISLQGQLVVTLRYDICTLWAWQVLQLFATCVWNDSFSTFPPLNGQEGSTQIIERILFLMLGPQLIMQLKYYQEIKI